MQVYAGNTMLKQERQAFILQQLNILNRVMSNDLLLKLQVSEDTVRRDLQELADEGRLIKVHGGALSKSFHFTLSANQVYLPEEKKTIAEKAANLISQNMVVLLTGGTTIRELIKALPPDLKATFITPSVPIALELMNHPNSEVIFIGNRLNKHAQMAIGAEVVRQLATIHADLCFMGTNAIDVQAGITESTWEIIEVKREMIRAADKLVSIAISEKLNTVQPLQVCPLKDIDFLVTELPPGDPLLLQYRLDGITLV
jgi:DeoR/GlpR family transcriptional regulator of sugar metabolism